MARAEADMALTPAGSPIPDPPYVTAPLGTATAGALQPEDDEDEEAQMLQGPVSHPSSFVFVAANSSGNNDCSTATHSPLPAVTHWLVWRMTSCPALTDVKPDLLSCTC